MATPVQQLLSRSIFETDGTTTVWDFSFSGGYLDRTHIKAFVLTPEGGQTDLVLNYDTQLIGPYQLLISPALSEGDELHIYRDTPKNLPLVDFTDGAVNSEIALDTNAKQAVFIAAESTDLVSLVRPVDLAVSVATSVAAAEAASASSASASAAAVAAGVARDEAVAASLAPTTDNLVNTAPSGLWSTVRGFITYLTGATGSAVVGFIQAGAGAVLRTLQAKLRDMPVDAADCGVVYDGVTDSTAALQAALDQHDRIVVNGPIAHGPVTITRKVTLSFTPRAVVTPIFSAGLTQSLYLVSAAKVRIEDFTLTAYAQTITANKYLIRAIAGGDGLQVMRPHIAGVTASDGNLGATNLLVCHAIYAEEVSDLRVIGGTVNGISGGAVFLKGVDGYRLIDNDFTNTRWYTVNADHDCLNGKIKGNNFAGDDVNARNWGGSINLQSNTAGGKNKGCDITGNTFSGVHNYGSVVRIQSAEDVTVSRNTFDRCTSGALLPGPLQYVSIARRGTAEGAAENGPCKNIVVANNRMTAGLGIHWPVYVQNQFLATRSPHEEIDIRGNVATSVDAASCFSIFAAIHGFKSGVDTLKVSGNIATVYTQAGSPGGAAIGFLATQASGEIDNFEAIDNHIEDLTTGVPTQSYQLGIFVQTHSKNGVVRGNTLKRFRYGYRQAASLLNVRGGNDNTFIDCLDDALMSGQPAGGGFDMSIGSTLPTSGVYRVGHVRQNPTAAASSSYGWVVTTAGGAMTGAWTSGLTYAVGEWTRNAAGRVYELITAGGGTVSVEPTHTTVGQDVTGADGYTWRCRSTASARWATLPALGAVVALP